jgi:hypothetical protein
MTKMERHVSSYQAPMLTDADRKQSAVLSWSASIAQAEVQGVGRGQCAVTLYRRQVACS